MRDVRLIGRPRSADVVPKRPHFIEGASILHRRQRGRPRESELRSALDGKWRRILKLWFGHLGKGWRRRSPHTWYGRGGEWVNAVPPIVRSNIENQLTDGRTERHAERFASRIADCR